MNTKGFSLIEMLVVMGIVVILFALTVPQLFRLRDRNVLQSATTKMLSDFREQQLKAMNELQVHGVHFTSEKYTQFVGDQFVESHDANIETILDYPLGFSLINIPNNTIYFASGSGEIIGFQEEHNSVMLEDLVHHEQHTIRFTMLGIPL
jgi:prepilin-type N-terminal cleavage/methylation domain-containing protein